MTVKKLISISDDLNKQIEEYNKQHPFEKLHISEIASKAIYERLKDSIQPTEPIATPAGISHTCLNCQAQFNSTANNAKFCNQACKSAHRRKTAKEV